eukprot:ANDGO_00787.mRNA.1 Sodium/potassium-transporting ATPase subunit alpha
MSRRPVERGTEPARVSFEGPRGRVDEAVRRSLDIVRISTEMRVRTQHRIEKRKRGIKHRVMKKDDLKREIVMDDHKIGLADLAARLTTSVDVENPSQSQGLSEEEADRRLKANGPNALTPPKTIPEWLKFLGQFTGFFSLLLEAGGILCFVAYALQPEFPDNLWLGIALWVVVVFTALFTYSQERKSANVLAGFRHLVPQMSKVVRSGQVREVPSSNLVVGDVIVLKGGDKVPADGRVMLSNGLKVDNSSLTGEAESLSRVAECTNDNPMETKNMIFYGTLCTEGTGFAIVIRTGDETLIGRIAGLASTATTEMTPLRREIIYFTKLTSALAISLGVLFFVLSLVLGNSFLQAVIYGIGLLVSLVPEGLLPTLTVALTLTASKMAQKKVLVKNLESVETLGSTTTICSDKTGTLTQNRMTVSHLWYNRQIVTSDPVVSEGSFDPFEPSFQHLLRTCIICNKAEFEPVPAGATADPNVLNRKTVGDASESALIKFGQPLCPISRLRSDFVKIAELPFNSTNKFQISIHRQPAYVRDGIVLQSSSSKKVVIAVGSSRVQDVSANEDASSSSNVDTNTIEPTVNNMPRLLVMKGAPERVLDRCSTYLDKRGQKAPVDDAFRAAFDKACNDLMSLGERVLGFAEAELDPQKFPPSFDSQYDFEHEDRHPGFHAMTFVGLVSLIDPPRLAVPEAVAKCRSAGIRVIMVTGDHPSTAKAIARNVGIVTAKTDDEVALENNISIKDLRTTRDDLWPQVRACVIHGQEIPELSEHEWEFILSRPEIVFARTSPQMKLQIVEHCQNRGEVVAVTGDGVNDSPALKKADIGIAMGITGSDVAKEAADMLLLDDNFASIVAGVEEGRLIFDNIKKCIAYMLVVNIPEVVPFIFFSLFGFPLALSVILVLLLSLGTDMLPAIALAYEEPEQDIMNRKPRNALTDRMVTSRLISLSYLQLGIMEAFAGMLVFFIALGDLGIPPGEIPGAGRSFFKEGADDLIIQGRPWTGDEQLEALRYAQTAYFCNIVVIQIFNLLMLRGRFMSFFAQGFSNSFLNFAIIFEFFLAVAITYIPIFHTIFQTRAIPFRLWLPGLAFAAILFTYGEIRKWVLRREFAAQSKGDLSNGKQRLSSWLSQKWTY